MQLRRVEVEVQPDWLRALEPIVAQLRSSCGLQPAHLSKFEAGLLALGQEIPGSPDLGPTAVNEESTIGELAYAVLRRQFTVLREKEPGTRLGEDIEELHDMRVATRRLRAALALFSHVLPVRAQTFREELGWLAGVLGAVRDLDVQIEGLDEMVADTAGLAAALPATDHDPLGELAALLEREREEARADMLDALDSVRWDRLAKGLSAMVQQGPARRSVATRVPAVVVLPDLIEARHTAVAKAAKRAKKSGVVTDFHRLRIRCKRLRYALEFSSEVYGGRTGRFVRQLSALQDELGQMQDAEVACLRLAELATGEDRLPAATVFLMGGVAENHRRQVERFLRGLPRQVRRVHGREWRDLSELMARRQAEAEAALLSARRTLRAVPRPPLPDVTEPAGPADPIVADHPSNPPGSEPVAGHGAQGLSALPPPPSSQGE
jgi:CHAD domain-containing protein